MTVGDLRQFLEWNEIPDNIEVTISTMSGADTVSVQSIELHCDPISVTDFARAIKEPQITEMVINVRNER